MTDTRDPNPERFPERIWLLRTIPTDPDAAGEVCPRWLDAPLENTERHECQEYRPVRVVVPVMVNWPYWDCPACDYEHHLERGFHNHCPGCGLELDWPKVEP